MPGLQISHALTGAVLCASLIVSYGLWKTATDNAEQELQTEFGFHTEEIIGQIRQRMTTYEEILYGLRALFDGSEHVTRDEFHTYVNSLRLDTLYPGIQGLSHAVLVPHAQKEQHIAEVRAQGFPDYTIHPAGEREEYTPVIYQEPFAGRNLKVFGYDTFLEAERRSTMIASRDSDEARMSGKLTLVQETENNKQAGFLVFLPLYRKDMPRETPSERRNSIYGWVTAVFRMDDLMTGLARTHFDDLSLAIYDGDTVADETRMYGSANMAVTAAAPRLSKIHKIEHNGHTWTTVIGSTPAFEQRLDRNLPAITGIAGLAFSTLLTLLAYAFVRARGITRNLAESEERWRYALKGAGDAVWDWDVQADYVNYSSQWYEMLGYTADEIGTSFSECSKYSHPDDVEKVMTDIQAHLDGKTPAFVNEHRIRHRDGYWCWVLDRGLVTKRAKDGTPLRMIGTHTDITERKLAEHELQEQRDFNNALVEAAGNVITVLDVEGRFVYFNPAAEKLTGFRRDELLGQPVWDWVIPGEQKAGVMEVFENLKAGNLDFATRHENDWLTRDGEYRTLDWHNTILHDENGNITHIVALGYELTERKRSEENIQKVTRLYSTLSHCAQAIVHSSSEAELFPKICRDAVDHGGFKMAWIGLLSESGQRVRPVASYGNATDFLNDITFTMDADTPYGRGPISTAIRENRPIWCQDCHNDPTTRPWHSHCEAFDLRASAALPLHINGKVVGTFNLYMGEINAFDDDAQDLLKQMASDISFALESFAQEKQRKQAEDELNRLNTNLESIVKERTNELMLAKEMADAANEAKSNFLSNMSHEIRTPLTAIIGFSEALLSSEFDRQEHEKLVTTIVRNSRHLQDIINDILDLSKIESNRLEHRLVDISPFTILAEIESLLGPEARDKGLDFSINYHFPLPAMLHSEPIYLKQILINLCSNASKFTSEGFVHVDASCDDSFRHLRITVTDSGIGMTPDEVARIFEPFIQADSTTTREYGGTGLGLAISSKLAEAIGGSLHCNSEKGKGSTFTLEIVNELADSSGVINSMEEIRALGKSVSEDSEIRKLAGKVLLVEDSPDNQELIEMLVRRTGASIDIAADGKHGVDMALAGDYDLVLMDMQMPVLDGLGAIRLLRKNDYSGPVISLTANALLTNREKCLAAGANDYLVKPIDTALFYDTLNRYLPAAEADAAPGKGEPGADRRKYGEFYNSPGYLEIVERFRNKLPQMVTELAEAVRREDWEQVQSQSHDLKGIGGSVGMPGITEVADRMNSLVKNGEYAQARNTCAELERIYQDILREENEETPAH